MDIIRKLRKTLTFEALRGGMELACRGDVTTVERLRRVALGLTRGAIPLRIRLARNMKRAGIYYRGLVDNHFARAVDQLIMLAHIFRAGFEESGCPEMWWNWLDKRWTRIIRNGQKDLKKKADIMPDERTRNLAAARQIRNIWQKITRTLA